MTRDFLRLSIVALLLALMTTSIAKADTKAPVSNEAGLLLPDLSADWWKDN